MPLSSNALTNLEAIKSYLKINSGQNTDDSRLEDLINSCSIAIENHCKRKFKEQTYSEEEYDGNGLKYLHLQQYPVKSVDSVTVDGILLSSDQYKVKKSNGTLIRTNSIWPQGDINVVVTYVAGYSTIPNDLELACKHLVMSYFKADIASFSTTFQEGFVFRPEALPAQVKALVQPYKKVV
ncbi:head-tail connector protein [Bacillus sp. UNC322MFChir4.1]|uniref:head-tail connector protein n=1 Tax=Bacillus sp. UNC322MFChir4.1 TaxID=1449045 RepID=UPI00068E6B06|nr:head-tail connector protein [Bacillus sp. UNC322MFChir4.1]